MTSTTQRNSTIALQAVCAIAFCLFAFVYLYLWQADLLAAAQHILSGGVTHYNSLVGAVIITLVLLLLQIGVASAAKLRKSAHALTYFPSAAVLALLTNVSFGPDGIEKFDPWWVAVPLLFLPWAAAVVIARRLQPLEAKPGARWFFSGQMWRNTLTMALLMLFVGLVGNGDAVMHYRLRAETCLKQGDVKGAMAAGSRSLETDASLTMTRAYALALAGQLGEALFRYPIHCKGSDMIPAEGSAASFIAYPRDNLFRFLGAKPAPGMTAADYLETLARSPQAKPALADYRLCSLLIDRRIDQFAALLPIYYNMESDLPRHYREALILYTHQRSNPTIVYKDKVLDTDYADFLALQRRCRAGQERPEALHSQYSNTYWWYYFSGS